MKNLIRTCRASVKPTQHTTCTNTTCTLHTHTCSSHVPLSTFQKCMPCESDQGITDMESSEKSPHYFRYNDSDLYTFSASSFSLRISSTFQNLIYTDTYKIYDLWLTWRVFTKLWEQFRWWEYEKEGGLKNGVVSYNWAVGITIIFLENWIHYS